MNCSVIGCTNSATVKGVCGGHYYRLRKYGDVLADVPLGKLPKAKLGQPGHNSGPAWNKGLKGAHVATDETRAKMSAGIARHGHAGNGFTTRSPTYGSWANMMQRCRNPKNPRWRDYGGRGISVCDRWAADFVNFLEDMGERPEGMTIDRIDNDGNYEPGNCRWSTPHTQLLNRRKSRKAD